MIKLSYIYKATNKINYKSYIGQTINFKSRKKAHIHGALKKNSKGYFANALRKYGKENFEWEILFEGECHRNKLNQLEIFFIAYYDTQKPNGYNLTPGGEFGDTLSKHPNKKEIYKKIGKTLSKTLKEVNLKTGLNLAQELSKIRYKLYGYKSIFGGCKNQKKFLGKFHSKETKRKMSKTHQKNDHQRGKKNSQYGKMWIYNLKLRESKRIDKNQPIPEGWLKGRKLNF